MFKLIKAALLLLALLSTQTPAATTVRYQHTDILGSVVAETDAAANIISRSHYEPFGKRSAGDKAGISYTGHLQDEDLNLIYMQQRYYDPVVGRFYSNDPVDMLGHMQRGTPTMGFNRYAYANNNPYKYVDPDGLATVFTWNAGSTAGDKSRAGHAAVMTKDGTYVSKFPTDGNGSKAEFHSFGQDVSIYGRGPDVVIDVTLPDESAATDFAKSLISDDSQTWSLNDNCADATVSVLNAGGANVYSGGIQSPASVDFNLKDEATKNENIKIIKDK